MFFYWLPLIYAITTLIDDHFIPFYSIYIGHNSVITRWIFIGEPFSWIFRWFQPRWSRRSRQPRRLPRLIRCRYDNFRRSGTTATIAPWDSQAPNTSRQDTGLVRRESPRAILSPAPNLPSSASSTPITVECSNFLIRFHKFHSLIFANYYILIPLGTKIIFNLFRFFSRIAKKLLTILTEIY